MTYREYHRVVCPHCRRRIAGVPDGEGLRLLRHRDRRVGGDCQASDRRIVRDLNAWKLERQR